MKRVRGPTDPDHHAAWVACREPDRSWCEILGDRCEPIDLRAKLDAALRAGWTPQALKACAFCCWRYTLPERDHVTRAAWRMAVHFADDSARARSFLEQFKADPEKYTAFVK
jgi:hypothetical protein